MLIVIKKQMWLLVTTRYFSDIFRHLQYAQPNILLWSRKINQLATPFTVARGSIAYFEYLRNKKHIYPTYSWVKQSFVPHAVPNH